MTATGTPASFPQTSSAAEASSSASATSVIPSSLPYGSTTPISERSAAMPATPIATSTSPCRQGRPKVSVMITATSTPSRSRRPSRSRAADASASSGSRATTSGATLEVSTPALARTNPACVSTMRVGPRRATTRRVSASTGFSRTDARSPSAASSCPSALLTILEVTMTTPPCCSRAAPAISPARSCPGSISGSPTTGSTESTSDLQRGLRERGGRGDIRHEQRTYRHLDPGDGRAGVGGVDEPGVEKPVSAGSGATGTVVPADAFGADFHADRREAGVGHPAYGRTTDDGGDPDQRHVRRAQRLPDPGYREDRSDR